MGSAYRSLQTIVSWFILQQYTDLRHPPTIPEIQAILHKIDYTKADKKFVGSKEWIGSSEITYVLEHLLGVECKQEHVASAVAIQERGRLLQHHFETSGTPVMIGGGQYAYTILGIDYNPSTGDMMLLILDPHYVGEDEVDQVLRKGGCGWQRVRRFFQRDCFYNLCIPKLPRVV